MLFYLLVEDHLIFAGVIVRLLKQNGRYESYGSCQHSRERFAEIDDQGVRPVLVDVSLPR